MWAREGGGGGLEMAIFCTAKAYLLIDVSDTELPPKDKDLPPEALAIGQALPCTIGEASYKVLEKPV